MTRLKKITTPITTTTITIESDTSALLAGQH